MSLSDKNSSQEKRNKALVESFIEEILNKHNLSAIEKYLGPYTGKGNEGFKQFLSAFFNAFPSTPIVLRGTGQKPESPFIEKIIT